MEAISNEKWEIYTISKVGYTICNLKDIIDV